MPARGCISIHTPSTDHLLQLVDSTAYECFVRGESPYLGKSWWPQCCPCSLPRGEYETCNAAIVAEAMVRSFTAVTLVLMTGFDGGIPIVVSNERVSRHIRLGVVTTSSPGAGQNCVLQLYLGETLSGSFTRTGYLMLDSNL